ncbi:cadherin-related family member 2-like [Mustelus asterias]
MVMPPNVREDGSLLLEKLIAWHLCGSGAFAVDNVTGRITVATLLDREQMRELITINITASELVKGVKDQSAATTTAVTILILDVNDNKPTFYTEHRVATDTFHVSVPEETPNSVPILHIFVQDLDQGNNGTFEVFLLGEDSTAFSLNQNTVYNEGILSLEVANSDTLDFEKNHVLQFQLFAVEMETQEMFSCVAAVRVDIMDRNDNSPVFDQDYFILEVQENSASGYNVTCITATDADSSDFRKITYRLLGSDSALQTFDVDPEFGTFFVKDETFLDREKRQQLFVTLQARDGGGLSTNVQIEVSISDANDEVPVFQRNSYTGFIKENVIKNIVQVQNFTLPEWARAPPKSAQHYVRRQACIQGRPPILFCQFVIQGWDKWRQEQRLAELKEGFGSSIVQAPIWARYCSSTMQLVNIIIQLHFQAFDKDQEDSPNSEITYRIVDGASAKYFTINSSTGIISAAQPLDRESMDASSNGIINLTVQATDCGIPAQSSTAQVVIKVEDVNDNEPVFNQSTFFVAVPEDQLGKSYVYEMDQCVVSIRATDNDVTDPNSLLSYRIEDGARGQFILSTEKGDLHQSAACIRVNPESRLDYDGGPRKYKLTVAANDFGFDPNTGRTTIEVDILDVNDETPVLIGSSLSDVFARENGQINTAVTAVQAFDPDTDAELHFFVRETECLNEKEERLSSSLCENWFQLVVRSGSLLYTGPVDRESVQAVRLRVQVVDYNTVLSLNMSEEGHIKIIITDENDNPPTFTRTEYKRVVVSELITEGFKITVFEATDRDVGKNGILTFHIAEVTFSPTDAPPLNKTAEEFFYIQTSLSSEYVWEGSLRIRNHLDFTRKGSWKVKVVVTDGGLPSNTAHHLLEVFVVDGSSKLQLVFDSPPGSVLLNEKETLRILEAAVPGTNVIVSKISPAVKNTNLRGMRALLQDLSANPMPCSSAAPLAAVASVGTAHSREDIAGASYLPNQQVGNGLRRTLMDVYFICGNGTAVNPDVVRGYQHKLKAASAMSATVLTSVQSNPMVGDVPGTNMHTSEG